MDRIAQQGDYKELQTRRSQHKLDNAAFNHMPLADHEHGILGATPVETMHAYRKQQQLRFDKSYRNCEQTKWRTESYSQSISRL
jgi:hypothetical protein